MKFPIAASDGASISWEFQCLLGTADIKQGDRPEGWGINPANK